MCLVKYSLVLSTLLSMLYGGCCGVCYVCCACWWQCGVVRNNCSACLCL